MASSALLKKNPYVIGVPIHDRHLFFGREELFAFIRDNLLQGARVILLSGQRRIGKSSVLLQIPEAVALPEFCFVSFDLQALTRAPLAEVLSELAEQIVNRLQLDRAILPVPAKANLESDPSAFLIFLDAVLTSLQGKRLVLLLDEFDVLDGNGGATSNFFPFLQSLLVKESRLFLIPVVGRRLDEIPRLLSLFKGAPHREIGLLNEQNTSRLITEPVAGQLDYTPEAIRAIRELTAGHPYFTQLLCHVIFQVARDENASEVTGQMVENSIPEAMESGEAGLAWFRDGLPVAERVVFSAIAEAQELRKSRPEPDFLALLEQNGVVVTDIIRSADSLLHEWGFVAGTPPTIMVEFVRRWLVVRHPVRRAIWELEQVSPEALQAYDQAVQARQAGDIAKVFDRCQAALEWNPNHLRALFDGADAALQLKEYRKAREYYERAAKVDARRAKDGLLKALVEEAARTQDVHEAVTLLLHAGALAPGDLIQEKLAAAQATERRSLALQNPFRAGDGTPAELFVGTTEELTDLLQTMRGGGSVCVYGEAGMGKTSLLQRAIELNAQDPKRAVTPYLNCTVLTPFTPQRFWQAVLRELGVTPADEAGGFEIEDQMKKAAGNRSVVLVLDDFDTLLPTDLDATEAIRFFQQFRSVLAHSDLSAIISSRRPLQELQSSAALPNGSPWFNLFRQTRLAPFDDAELGQLVTKMPSTFALEDGERRWICDVTGGYPYLAQSALSILFRRKAGGVSFDLRAATEELLAQSQGLFTAIWAGAWEEERDVLAIVSLLNLARRVRSQVLPPPTHRARRSLESRGLISEQRGGLELTSPLLEWWIIQWLQGLTEEELLARAERLSGLVPYKNELFDLLFGTWSYAGAKIELWARPAASMGAA